MTTLLTSRLGAVLMVTALHAGAAFAIGSAPAPVSGNALVPLTEPKRLDLSTLPAELGSLRLDGLVSRSGQDLSQRCGELAPIARAVAQDEPQRPGPLLVVSRCARATGDSVGAAQAFAQMRERVAASLAPPGLWQGDAYYFGVGTLDVAAVAAALDPDADARVIASSLEVSSDGYRVHELFWLRGADARVRRVRVDVTPGAERVLRYLARQVDDAPTRDLYVALAGSLSVNIRAGQLAAESQALVGRARIAVRTGQFGGKEQARKDLDRAIAQDDAFARYVLAEWLLADPQGDTEQALELLRRAGAQGLPEAQALLASWCKAHRGCRSGEAAAAQRAAVDAYGEAEVALLRYEAGLRLGFGDGTRELERAIAAGSARALALRIGQLAREPIESKRDARERDALLQRGVDQNLTYALERQGLAAHAQAKTAAERAAARATLERAAAGGSARAAAQLGVSYATGEDGDPLRAIGWHRLAAERGDATGQFNYAGALLGGRGVDADPAAARVWYLRSAMQGLAASARALGDIHARGDGIAADTARAVPFYAAAARLGDARGQYLYALALDLGDGIAADRAAARSWYERAAAQGMGDATVALARIELTGPSPQAGIARLDACAAQGDAMCQLVLADALLNGPAPLRDGARALALYEQAAGAGDPRALNVLGAIYLHGEGVAADEARAFGYFARCAESDGDGAAACVLNLGRAYLLGVGVTADRSRALATLRRAHELGSADASCLLGGLAREDGDADEARRRYAEAAAAGSAWCMRLYGLELLDGDAAQAATAMDWLRKAAAAGDASASGEIVAALTQPESALYDLSAGLAYAEQCAAAADYACLAAAGGALVRSDDAAAVARGFAWLERAAQRGEETAARVLGHAAYYGYGRKRDRATARHWLTLADPQGLSAVLLARLEVADGYVAVARQRLVDETAGGNAYAQFALFEFCARTGADCGSHAPTAEVWLANLERRGEARARELLNEVIWAVATDPLASADDAQRLVALAPRARYGLSDELSHRDSWAALLARAGRLAEACALQRRIVTDAHRAKADKWDLRDYEKHRDAFCRAATWDWFD